MQQGVLNASYWDAFYRSGNDWGQPRSQILAIVKDLQQGLNMPAIRVLELACGNGRYVIPLAELGARVDCIDFSKVAITQLRTRAEERGVADLVQSHWGDVKEFPIKPYWYHLVLASGLFEYLRETELRMLIRDIQAGTVVQGINVFVWLLQHPQATVIPGEHPLVPGTVEDIYMSSTAWEIILSQTYLKEDCHPLERNGKPQKHKHYVGRMVAKRIAE
jgi:tellurite methyltransferase